jgi:hypothetical protein
VASKTIAYRDIRCHSRFEVPPADERCHRIEQRKLDQRITNELISQAVRIYEVSVTDEEVLALAKDAMPKPEHLQKLDADLKAMAKAALEVMDGADVDAVYRRELLDRGIARPYFDATLRTWDRAAAEKALHQDHVAEARRQLITQFRQREELRRLNDVAGALAAKDHVSPEEAWRGLWREVIDKTETRVVDPRFSMPDLEIY